MNWHLNLQGITIPIQSLTCSCLNTSELESLGDMPSASIISFVPLFQPILTAIGLVGTCNISSKLSFIEFFEDHNANLQSICDCKTVIQYKCRKVYVVQCNRLCSVFPGI